MISRHSFSPAALIAAAVLVIGAPTSASAAQFIVNGSFEADNFDAGGGYRLGLVGSAVTGWFIPASDGVYPWGLTSPNAFGAGPASHGKQWIVLGETGAGGPSTVDYTIQQTVTGLTPGNVYTLSFDLSSELAAATGAVAEVGFLSGASLGPTMFTAPVRGPAYWNPWGSFSVSFTATSSTAVLQFKDLAVEFPAAADLGIDNVSITGANVPEPSTWALTILGFGALGLLLRRRQAGLSRLA